MAIYETVKETILQHKSEVELLQTATINGIAALVYSDYVKLLRLVEKPTRHVLCPAIENVRRFLESDSELMKLISERLVEDMRHHFLVQRYYHKDPSFTLFDDDNAEIMKMIMDMYILPNAGKVIPNVITKKFRFDDPAFSTFIEDRDTYLFAACDHIPELYDFILEEVVLNIVIKIDGACLVEEVDKNLSIPVTDDEIISITNDIAICDVLLSTPIFALPHVSELLLFVTNSIQVECDPSASTVELKGREYVARKFATTWTNHVKIYKPL